MRSPSCRLVALLACALAVLAAAAAAGATHLAAGYWHYTYKSCAANLANRTDPVVVVFTRDATAENTRLHLGHHTGWEPTRIGATDVYFGGAGWCARMDHQLADGSFTRFHVRYRQSPHVDDSFGTVTLATPHHEDYVDPGAAAFHGWDCSWHGSHAVDETGTAGSGFDQGRAKIYQRFTGTHHVYGGTGYWGNTWRFEQCDEGVAWSNGNVGWWRIDA
jgi:hypothetical protein